MNRLDCIILDIITLVISLSLVSCHFGDAEDMRPSFADKKRNVEYSFTVGFPYASAEVYSVEDFDVEGLRINWNESESLAVFGKSFVMQADTFVGAAAFPEVLKLQYDARRDGASSMLGNVKTLQFDFNSWVTHGEGDEFAQPMPILYPYSQVLDKTGAAPKANVDSLEFDFNRQNGQLQQLRDSFFIAMGQGVGVVKSGVGSITTGDDEYVRLVPKFALLRIALTFPAELPYTLNEYISVRSFSESVRYIDNIVISNENEQASGFNKAVLNLNSGEMSASENALPLLVLRSNNAFTTLTDVPYDNFTLLGAIGGSQKSWGTMLYVAVPCTDKGHLDLDALIEVNVIKRSDNSMEHYYGRLSQVTLEEGSYYLTSSVNLNPDSQENLDRAEVLRVPEVIQIPE